MDVIFQHSKLVNSASSKLNWILVKVSFEFSDLCFEFSDLVIG